MGRELYVGANGDCWTLVRDTALAAFLVADRGGPEHRALWTLIGLLAGGGSTSSTAMA